MIEKDKEMAIRELKENFNQLRKILDSVEKDFYSSNPKEYMAAIYYGTALLMLISDEKIQMKSEELLIGRFKK